MPDMDMAVGPFTATMASIGEHAEAGTLVRGLPAVPPEIPVLFLHGAGSPMPLRASTDTAALVPHARVEIVEGAGHFIWLEQPGAVRDAVRAIV
jgi:pimeloyl-ACP methyl ester carboxylesterase